MSESDAAAPSPPLLDAQFADAYDELRRLARSRLRHGGRNTVLDTTALVHETYLWVSKSASTPFPDPPRFLLCRQGHAIEHRRPGTPAPG